MGKSEFSFGSIPESPFILDLVFSGLSDATTAEGDLSLSPLYWPVIPVCGAINWNIENLTERGEERRTCKELLLVEEQGNKVIDTDHTSRPFLPSL